MLHAAVSEQSIGSPTPSTGRAVAALARPHSGNQALLRNSPSPPPRPSRTPLLQRACAACKDEREKKEQAGLQTKLAVNAPGDVYEQEADRVADQVMRMCDPQAQRQPSKAGSDGSAAAAQPPRIQRLADAGRGAGEVGSDLVTDLGSGAPLDAASRGYFEPRFGHDFGEVRVHTGPQADNAAASVQARAFTLGRDLVFAAGEHDPGSERGRRLLAHELTHVVQQAGGLQRGGQPGGAVQRKEACATAASCPAEFCLEFPSEAEAISHRDANRSHIVAVVGNIVVDGGSSEVTSLYNDFLDGGQGHRDLSDRLAPFFTKSSTTGRTIRFLDRSLEQYFQANPPPPGGSTTVNIRDAIPDAITALGTPGDPNVMAFRDYSETPGVLAGGVGVGQVGCAVGKKPSKVEDSRTATGTATGTNSNGTMLVASTVEFTATDTLDFCPGNCGGENAQEMTIPLSRYEATGISGDVPFTVTFPAPIGAFDSE